MCNFCPCPTGHSSAGKAGKHSVNEEEKETGFGEHVASSALITLHLIGALKQPLIQTQPEAGLAERQLGGLSSSRH